MEAMGAEGQWSSLSGVYTAEEADFMALLLNNQLSSVGATSQHLWPPQHYHESTTILMNNNNYCSLELSSASSSSACSGAAPNNSFINVFPKSNDHLSSTDDINNNVSHQPTTHSFDFFDLAGDLKPYNHSHLVQGDHHHRRGDIDDRLSSEENGSGGEAFPAPRDIDQKKMIKPCPSSDHHETSAKRPRSFEKVDQVGKKFTKSKKKQKIATTRKTLGDNNEEESGKNNGNMGHCSSSTTTCCSGDESIGQETSGGDDSSLSPKEPHSDSKSRARRGSATDPQSLYARKRRERINERLRILQTLVPNGTKVDISTMLEEAVQYVKFLQLQIKLLSSDELWMYAPIAYNGKDIGLDHLKLSLANK